MARIDSVQTSSDQSSRPRRRPLLRLATILPVLLLLAPLPPGALCRTNAVPQIIATAAAVDAVGDNGGRDAGIKIGGWVRDFWPLSRAGPPPPPSGVSVAPMTMTTPPTTVVVGGIGDPKNFPAYLIQAVVASEILTRLGRIWDPTAVISVVNLLVFLAWDFAKRERDLELLVILKDNFLLHGDPETFEPRQVLLRGFSHMDPDHLKSNLAALMATGPFVRKYLSNWRLFPYPYFYVFSLYASSLFDHFVYSPMMDKDQPEPVRFLFWSFIPKRIKRRRFSLGASGAVSAVMAFCGLAFPNEKYSAPKFEDEDTMADKKVGKMIDEIPMWYVASIAFLSDIIMSLKASKEGKRPNVGHGAHIGGSLFGASVYLINRLCGNSLRELVHTSAARLMKLIPARVTYRVSKIWKSGCRIATKSWRVCCNIAVGLGRLCRRVCEGVISILPWRELRLLARMAIQIAEMLGYEVVVDDKK